MTEPEPFPFDDLIVELSAQDRDLSGILVIPTHRSMDGGLSYSEFDASAVKVARSAGVENVSYLRSQRQYAHEFSASWLFEIGLAIPATLAADLILNVTKYVWSRVLAARMEGLVSPADDPFIRVHIASFETGSHGKVSIEGISIEGTATDAVVEIARLFSADNVDVVASTYAALSDPASTDGRGDGV